MDPKINVLSSDHIFFSEAGCARQCFQLRPARATSQSWPAGKGLLPWQSTADGPTSALYSPGSVCRRWRASPCSWRCSSQAFSGSQTSAKQRLLPAYRCLSLLCPSILLHLGPKSPYVRKQGNVAAFHVSGTPGCCPASPLTVILPAAFTSPAYLPILLCQVRPCLRYPVTLPRNTLLRA